MTTPKVRWEEMLPHEFIGTRDRFPLCWMAFGLAEPHGAYNALGLDWLKAYSLVEIAARQYGGIVAPPFAWHIQELPYRGDHAGVCETSQLMALRPGLTDLQHRTGSSELGERFAGGVDFEKGPMPSAQIGKTIVGSQVRNLGLSARQLLEEHRAKDGWIAPDLNVTMDIADEFIRLNGK